MQFVNIFKWKENVLLMFCLMSALESGSEVRKYHGKSLKSTTGPRGMGGPEQVPFVCCVCMCVHIPVGMCVHVWAYVDMCM